MKTKPNNFASASALQITFSIALILASAILLASARVATPILGNYPDTTLALSTDTTVTPDAPPTNTTSINISTSTDFKGTLAGDPTTGVVRVTDAHPAGTYTVTVTAFDSGGESVIKTFRLRVRTPVTCNPVGFAAAVSYGDDIHFQAVAVGDFNGDGKQDLATADGFSFTVSILLGDGAGHFSAARTFPVPYPIIPWSVAVGDFNADGKQDLAVGSYGSDTVSILLGDGAGNLSAPTYFVADYAPLSVAVGDFNGDGKQDLATANDGRDSVSILLGDGAGHFSAPTNFSAGDYPDSVVVGDFNGDGKQDLAVANDLSNNVSVLLGDGAGNFSAPINFTAGPGGLKSVAVGDFNGDGEQDLATANSGESSVSILLGDGAGNFSAPTNFGVGANPLSVAVGDFNGDGKQDLATANYGGNVSILLGDGAGNFSSLRNFGAGYFGYSVAVGDFDGDGQQDLAVASTGDGVLILLRDCPASQITPAATTCNQFASGTAETLSSVQYDVNNGLIHRVNPRNFLYWVKVRVPAGDRIFRITQTITTGNFNTFFTAIVNVSKVFDSDCVPLQRSIRQSGDTVTVRFNAPVAGTYYIAINFNAQSLLGEPGPGPGTTVHYEFTTRGVPDSTSVLNLVHY